MPDMEKLEDAGLLGRTSEALLGGDALASELREVLGYRATKTSARKMRRNKMAPGQPDISPRNKFQQRLAIRRAEGPCTSTLGTP